MPGHDEETSEKQPWRCRPDLAFRWASLYILLSSGNNHEFHTVRGEKWARTAIYATEYVTGSLLVPHIAA